MSLALTGIGISVADYDTRGGSATCVLAVTRGTVAVAAGNSGITSITNSGTASVTFHGTIDQLNKFFQGSTTGTCIHTSSTTGAVTYTLTITDEDSLSTTITFTGTVATFAAPVLVIPGASISSSVGVAKNLNGLSFGVTDSDDITTSYATLVIAATVGAGSPGTITAVPGASGTTIVSGNVSSSITLTGTIASLSHFLAGDLSATWTITPATLNNNTLTFTCTDSTGQIGTGTKTITVVSPPVVVGPAAFLAASTAVAKNIHGAGFSYTDSDDAGAGGQTLLITTTDATLAVVVGNSGCTLGANSTTSASLTGTKAQLNNLMQGSGTGTIKFTRATDGSSTLTMLVTDNTGLTDTKSVSIVASPNTPTWTGYATASPLATSVTIAGFVAPIDLSKLPQAWWDAVSPDGRDIRVTDDSNTLVPHDLVLSEFNKTNKTGRLFAKITNGLVPPIMRVWVGASNATAPAVGDANGQYNVYSSFIRAFWPNGGDSDRTNYANVLTGVNSPTFGGATSDFGPATDYSGNKYATVTGGGIQTTLPATFLSFINPSQIKSAMTAMDSGHGPDATNTALANTSSIGIVNSKIAAETFAYAVADGSVYGSTGPSAVGNLTTGIWQLVAASFLTSKSRKAYRAGGNVAANTTNLGVNGSLIRYSVGARVRDKTVGFIVDNQYQGLIGLSLILSNIDSTLIAPWIANYSVAFNQTTYWNGGWTFVSSTLTGL